MMKVIIDSGGTKAKWAAISNDGIIDYYYTVGFNPYFIDRLNIEKEVKKSVLVNYGEVSVIYFYGAGCSSYSKNESLRKAFQAIFRNANIYVEHDLLGAARATCGFEKGFVGILGTGANSGYYDGETVVSKIPSLGFILGDQGSGSFMGKKILGDYLSKQMSIEIATLFNSRFEIDLKDVLESVYSQNFPNRYLAQFTLFLSENIDQLYCKKIVERAINEFVEIYIEPFVQKESEPLYLVGSVAKGFENIIEEVCRKKNISIGNILKDPIPGLIVFHSNNN